MMVFLGLAPLVFWSGVGDAIAALWKIIPSPGGQDMQVMLSPSAPTRPVVHAFDGFAGVEV